MTRDQALIIADRIMRRIEGDKAIHRDSLADELVMGMALSKPAIVQSFVDVAQAKEFLQVRQEQFAQWTEALHAARQRGYLMGGK